jgi:SAM-dependent methyltransferase
MRALALLSLSLCTCAIACGPATRAPATTTAPPPAAAAERPDAAAPAEPLPPGVLARAQGTQGTIEVIERDGLRQLVIAGQVHAAVPVGGEAAPDPMVALVRAARPEARRALVIGLGSGQTATQLAAAGFQVTAVELEPAVIDFARRYFGYTGDAIAGDGLGWLRESGRGFDVILVDAFVGAAPPADWVSGEGLALLREGAAGDGALAWRLLDTPTSATVAALTARVPRERRFRQLFGSGVGDEAQNLYYLESLEPLSFVADPAVPVWPLLEPGSEALRLPSSRDVTLVGYLVRVGPERTLCLDLLHWEMGAVRFVLAGDAARALEPLLPAKSESPSQGDIAPDGDVSQTLHGVYGSAGFKRSDVRYSPVVVAVRGRASYRAAIDPDDLPRLREEKRALLPYGGTLYDLEVTDVPWRFDLATWKKLRKTKLDGAVKRAVAAAKRGDLGALSEALGDYQAALDAALGPWGEHFELRRRMLEFRGRVAVEAAALGAGDLALAVACDRLADDAEAMPPPAYFQNPDVIALAAPLRATARRLYKKVLAAEKPGTPEHEQAKERLESLDEAEK